MDRVDQLVELVRILPPEPVEHVLDAGACLGLGGIEPIDQLRGKILDLRGSRRDRRRGTEAIRLLQEQLRGTCEIADRRQITAQRLGGDSLEVLLRELELRRRVEAREGELRLQRRERILERLDRI